MTTGREDGPCDSSSGGPLDDALTRLFAAPLEAFVEQRKALAATLRAAGDPAAAKQLAATAKPTRTAWALNQVVRERPELLGAFLKAREVASELAAGDVDRLRRATRDYRERLNEVVHAARGVLEAAGQELNAAQARRVAETLQAVGAEDGEVRARLMRGMLTHDVDVEDPFAGVVVAERSAASAATAAGQTRPSDGLTKEPDREHQRRLEQERREREEHARLVAEGRARVAELEAAARETQSHARKTQSAANEAAREAERARKAADQVEGELEDARAALERLRASSSSRR